MLGQASPIKSWSNQTCRLEEWDFSHWIDLGSGLPVTTNVGLGGEFTIVGWRQRKRRGVRPSSSIWAWFRHLESQSCCSYNHYCYRIKSRKLSGQEDFKSRFFMCCANHLCSIVEYIFIPKLKLGRGPELWKVFWGFNCCQENGLWLGGWDGTEWVTFAQCVKKVL